MASTNPKDGPTGRKQVERGDRGGGYRWVPRSEVRDTERDPDILRSLRHHRRGHPGVHRVTRGVRNTDNIVAVPLSVRSEFAHEIGGEWPEQKTDAHHNASYRTGAPIQHTREATAPCNSLYHLDFRFDRASSLRAWRAKTVA